MDEEALQKAFQTAGWLLGRQLAECARGEIPKPLAAVEGQKGIFAMNFNTTPPTYERLVLAGRSVMDQKRESLRYGALSHDADLGELGRIVILEVWWRGSGETVELAQRYCPVDPENEFLLLGEAQLLGEELVSDPVRKALAACGWQDLLAAGAASSGQEELWHEWTARRTIGRSYCEEDDLCFLSPPGWLVRRGEESDPCLVVSRLFPSAHNGHEPVILVKNVSELWDSLDEAAALIMEKLVTEEVSILRSESFAVPSLAAQAFRVCWEGVMDGRQHMTHLVLVSRAGETLYQIMGIVLMPESWDETGRALEELLASCFWRQLH